MKTLIVIPARFGSTRLPGKPLAMIGGKSLLSWVVGVAKEVAKRDADVDLVVATEDERILRHCQELGVKALMTSPECATGTDRALEAATRQLERPDFVINLQGDAPFTPPDFIEALILYAKKVPTLEIVTPVHKLRWQELDLLREHKVTTPFSGTTAIIDGEGRALWFSKSVLPQIRDEERWRLKSPFSPIYGHVGLYGYTLSFLEQFVSWPLGHYEALEGLEQLRVLENGGTIHTVVVDYKGRPRMTGVDSPEDLERAERVVKEFFLR